MFLNREAGFVIKRTDLPDIRVGQKMPYESYPHEISEIKQKWSKLRKQVTEQWQPDKTDLPVFNI